jgi:hypothetical protein
MDKVKELNFPQIYNDGKSCITYGFKHAMDETYVH